MPRPIPYSAAERNWIETRKSWPRPVLHAHFVAEFDRPDVDLIHIMALCKRERWLTGRNGQFPKGTVPPNKGKKVPLHKQAVATQFKKGQVPPNVKPFGHERVCTKDGYVMIKVDMINPYTGGRGYYMAKQKWNWIQKNGPIPKGHVLRCLDGDKTNTDLSNWALITQRENAALNTALRKANRKNLENLAEGNPA